MGNVGKFSTKEVTKLGILIALTTVMTMIAIPSLGRGYLNLGDMVVFLAAMIMGKMGGAIVGGIGSALADFLLGYSIYAPFTLIVKGLEGFIAGVILDTKIGKRFPIVATMIGAIVMVSGYFVSEIFLYGSKVALIAIPGNIIQGSVGAVASILLYTGIKKVS